MIQAKFNVRCPYQLNDKVILENEQTAVITDIMTVYSLKSGKAEFQYELNNSGQYVRFATPEKKGTAKNERHTGKS